MKICTECGVSSIRGDVHYGHCSASPRGTPVPATPAPTRPEPEAPTCTHCGGEGFLWKNTAGGMLQYRGKCVCSAAAAPVPEDREEATKTRWCDCMALHPDDCDCIPPADLVVAEMARMGRRLAERDRELAEADTRVVALEEAVREYLAAFDSWNSSIADDNSTTGKHRAVRLREADRNLRAVVAAHGHTEGANGR